MHCTLMHDVVIILANQIVESHSNAFFRDAQTLEVHFCLQSCVTKLLSYECYSLLSTENQPLFPQLIAIRRIQEDVVEDSKFREILVSLHNASTTADLHTAAISLRYTGESVR